MDLQYFLDYFQRHLSKSTVITSNITTMFQMWERQGMSVYDMKLKTKAIVAEFQFITVDMIRHEEKNEQKVKILCSQHRCLIQDLRLELGIEDEEDVSFNIPLLSMEKELRESKLRLETEKERRMQTYRKIISEKEALETFLGEEEKFVYSDTIPTEKIVNNLKKHVDALNREKESREDELFQLKESMINVLDDLGWDLNTTTLSSLICNENYTSLYLSHLKDLRETFNDLQHTHCERHATVKRRLKEIKHIYDLLELEVQNPLVTSRVCANSELTKDTYFFEIEDEYNKMNRLKKANLELILSKKRAQVLEHQRYYFYREEDIEAFNRKYEEISEVSLAAVEQELQRLQTYQNEELVKDCWELFHLYDLAKDLVQRENNPDRLFKSRGGKLIQEEKDRKKVNTIPSKFKRLMSILPKDEQNTLLIYGEPYQIALQEKHNTFLMMMGHKSNVTNNSNTISMSSQSRITCSSSSRLTISRAIIRKNTLSIISPGRRFPPRIIRTSPTMRKTPSPSPSQKSTRLALARHGNDSTIIAGIAGINPSIETNSRPKEGCMPTLSSTRIFNESELIVLEKPSRNRRRSRSVSGISAQLFLSQKESSHLLPSIIEVNKSVPYRLPNNKRRRSKSISVLFSWSIEPARRPVFRV